MNGRIYRLFAFNKENSYLVGQVTVDSSSSSKEEFQQLIKVTRTASSIIRHHDNCLHSVGVVRYNKNKSEYVFKMTNPLYPPGCSLHTYENADNCEHPEHLKRKTIISAGHKTRLWI